MSLKSKFSRRRKQQPTVPSVESLEARKLLAADLMSSVSSTAPTWVESDTACVSLPTMYQHSSDTASALAFSAASAAATTSPNQELWVAPGHGNKSIDSWATTSNGEANFSFGVPANVTDVTRVVVVAIARKSRTIEFDLEVSAAQDGEHLPNMSKYKNQGPVQIHKDSLIEIDITSYMPTDLEAGRDSVGLEFESSRKSDLRIVGLRFQYKGAAGPQGDTGAVGPQGLQGVAGATGPKGPAGDDGADGVDGAQGPQGDTGPQGNAGPVGPQGPVGADGAQGPAGADGATGPQGPQGDTGATGSHGPQGDTGPRGPAGTTDWEGISNIPDDIADGDQDTIYTAGDLVLLLNEVFSVDIAGIEELVAAKLNGYATESELAAYAKLADLADYVTNTAFLTLQDRATAIETELANFDTQTLQFGPDIAGSPTATPQGSISFDPSLEKLLVSNGTAWQVVGADEPRVQRDLLVWNSVSNLPAPVHIKTNIQAGSNTMYRISVDGYNYGESALISSLAAGFAYSNGSLLGADVSSLTAGATISQYLSTDGYVVIRLDARSFYYAGFSVSAWFVNPTGNFEMSAEVFRQSSSL